MLPREIPVKKDDTLYSMVYSLGEGTVFQITNGSSIGAPWLRTAAGVVDLVPLCLPVSLKLNSIPDGWKAGDYDDCRVIVIYEEES